MQPIDWVFVLIFLCGSGIIVSLILFQKHIQKKSTNEVQAIFSLALSAGRVIELPESSADLAYETLDLLFLIKVVRMNPANELIITNRLYWCINDNPGAWRRSTLPNLVDHIESFVAFEPKTAKKIMKLCILTPDCKNITRYLNEADVEVVKPADDVWGVHFLRITALADYLTSFDKKQFTK